MDPIPIQFIAKNSTLRPTVQHVIYMRSLHKEHKIDAFLSIQRISSPNLFYRYRLNLEFVGVWESPH